MMGGDPRTSQIKVSSGFLLRILAKPPLVPQRGVATFKMGPGWKWDTRPLLEDQSLGKVLVRTKEGELRPVPVLLVLDLGAPWVLGLAKVVQIPAWSVCVSGCLQVEDPQWELSLRGLFAFASGSGIEFHYCVMELSLLHIPHPFLWLAWARTWGHVCRWAEQPSGGNSEVLEKATAGTAKDRGWLWISTKSRKRFSAIFTEWGQKTLSEHGLSSARISQSLISSLTTGSVLWKPTFG